MQVSRPWARAMSLALGLAAAGCGSQADELPREPIAGKVVLDGRPLETGLVTFTPAGPDEPVVTAIVEAGEFRLSRAEGPVPGAHRVSVWAKTKTGKKVKDPDDPEKLIDETKNLIPPRYNLQSELTAEVKAGGANRFEFPLSTAKAKVAQGARPGRR